MISIFDVGRSMFDVRCASFRHNSLGDRRGFTLLEVLVALAVLGIAVTVIFQLFSANLQALSASENYVEVSLRAAARMRELLDDRELTERVWSEVSPEGYRLEFAVKEALAERTELLPVRLLEVALTIRWNRGNRERSLTFQTLKLQPKEL
jgi:prepilin-type N-terminal cleavage/methylation domain-containing protein